MVTTYHSEASTVREHTSSMPLFDDQPGKNSPVVKPDITCPVCAGKGTRYRNVRALRFGESNWQTVTCSFCDGSGKMPALPEIPLNASVVDTDIPRLSRQHFAIIRRLREGPAQGPELLKIAARFGARLEELKRAGYIWTKTSIGRGQFLYKLLDRGEST